MAPVDVLHSSSMVPTIIFGAHGFWVAWLSIIVFSSIYESYIALPPSSATRHRQPLRRGHVQVFAALAITSLVSAAYYAVKLTDLSYGVWATERGIERPTSIFGDYGAFRGGYHPGRMHIVRWLNDTPFYQDALEVVAEKARYFWWGQQVNLGLVSWSMYLAIEGRRRKIPHLWSFLALAQLVNLSYAQNLFFVAVLLTPVPLPDNVSDFVRGPAGISRGLFSRLVPNKPDGFLPKPGLYIALLSLSFATIFLVPFASNTPSFMTVSVLARSLPFTFLALPYIIPSSWGSVQTDPHASHHAYTTLFRLIATFSALLHLKSTGLAIVFNAPESQYHRHSLLHPFETERRSTFIRGYTAVNKVIGAIREHPTVASVGWDVILSGFSLGVWAAIRGLEIADIIGASTPFLKRTERKLEEAASAGKEKITNAVKEIEQTPIRRRGRHAKDESVSIKQEDSTAVVAPKRRGRPPKNPAPIDDEDASDTTYQPSAKELIIEGDEDADDEWESSALSWGLMSVSGLASASAGIFGAEILAR